MIMKFKVSEPAAKFQLFIKSLMTLSIAYLGISSIYYIFQFTHDKKKWNNLHYILKSFRIIFRKFTSSFSYIAG